MGYGFCDVPGVDLIGELRPAHPGVAWMLVSNHADAQAAAVAAGALPGFGKSELGHRRLALLLRKAVGFGADPRGT